MNHSWLKTVFPIATIFSFRLMGLFLLIPVFSVYAATLNGATSTLIGFALGGYGLAQGLLQIPFGMLSDKYGRKPILLLGLFLFIIGSLVGAITDSIYGMILARTLQGAGAIGSVLIALLADLTPDNQRTRAMAVVGVSIGISFSLAMVISPIITSFYGLAGIFWLTIIMATSGIFLICLVIPNPKEIVFHDDTETNISLVRPVLKNSHLQKLNYGIFTQHFILTSTFFAIPMLLNDQIQLGHLTQQWHFYLPLMLFSFILMIPFIILSEKKHHLKMVFILAVLFTAISQGLLALTCQDWYSLCALMFVYFIAFNVLEASLPSLVSKQANRQNKGTAMGIYSTSQFLGIFFGGALAGILYQWHGHQAIFTINMLFGIIWLFVSFLMNPTAYRCMIIIDYRNSIDDFHDLQKQLLLLPGVQEAKLVSNEHALHLLVDNEAYTPGSAEKVFEQFNTTSKSINHK
ncbi:MFS transporter [Legionella waltersii]|uniref:Major facilitator family transporter transporter n=1 Tax=Legionella waltersii TaxID=66969 RepID=A0A0W1A297_9GAMM|nr:MFS transporter [Legionella waltersii]KTD75469.1 major facilitator family transporter transporter [Legionella waltersii]SNU98140.1 major facilitator family transporter [Legionella waltersii]